MTSLVFLIEQFAPAFYIFIGLAIVLYGRQWQQARRIGKTATFRLERDLHRQKLGHALMAMALLFEAGLVVLGIERVVAPTVREDRDRLGVEVSYLDPEDDGIFRTPTPLPPSGTLQIEVGDYGLGQQEELAIRLTPVPTNTPVGTIEPADDPLGCNTPNATFQIPANGMRVFQTIRVAGTAYSQHFSFYRIELSGPSTFNQFVILDESTIPMEENGTLSQFNPARYEPGEYKFRLMVFDTTTTLQAHCQITIYINEPIPTPTPF